MDLEFECEDLKKDLKGVKSTQEEFIQRIAALRQEKESLKEEYIQSLNFRTQGLADAVQTDSNSNPTAKQETLGMPR